MIRNRFLNGRNLEVLTGGEVDLEVDVAGAGQRAAGGVALVRAGRDGHQIGQLWAGLDEGEDRRHEGENNQVLEHSGSVDGTD